MKFEFKHRKWNIIEQLNDIPFFICGSDYPYKMCRIHDTHTLKNHYLIVEHLEFEDSSMLVTKINVRGVVYNCQNAIYP